MYAHVCNYDMKFISGAKESVKNVRNGCQVKQTLCFCGFEGTYGWGFQRVIFISD